MNCTRCQGTGFLNFEQVPAVVCTGDVIPILRWMADNPHGDVMICDCCGDGFGWYGEPGQHYTNDDPMGKDGPYAYNGGLCECH